MTEASRPVRESKIRSVEEAAAHIRSGMTISIGGFINSSHPMSLLRQVIRNGVRDLTVIGAASAGLEIDMLIAAGCVRKLIAPYVGAEGLAPIANTITASAGVGGTISPSGPVSVACGGSQNFAITPADTCHVIADVLVDAVSVGPVPTYTFSDVQANHTIQASFTLLLTCQTVAVEVTDLAVEANEHGVSLSWKLSRDAQQAIQSVGVQRGESPDGPFVARTTTGLTPSASMSFQDADVVAGHTYYYRLVLTFSNGEFDVAGPVRITVGDLGNIKTALQAPVVTGGVVEIRYTVGRVHGAVQLDVFDVGGHRVRSLVQGTSGAGQFLRTWDRRDASGAVVARGVYMIRLKAGDTQATQKVVLLHE